MRRRRRIRLLMERHAELPGPIHRVHRNGRARAHRAADLEDLDRRRLARVRAIDDRARRFVEAIDVLPALATAERADVVERPNAVLVRGLAILFEQQVQQHRRSSSVAGPRALCPWGQTGSSERSAASNKPSFALSMKSAKRSMPS